MISHEATRVENAEVQSEKHSTLYKGDQVVKKIKRRNTHTHTHT